MKKLLAVLSIALVVAAAVWVIVRVQLANRLAAVPELLPKETLLLVEMPDLNETRKHWHESDLYKIWREPAVQTWLREPLDRLPQKGRSRQTLEELLQLHPTRSFIALTALENNEPKLLGGFHFEASPEEARHFIQQREEEWTTGKSGVRRETIAYRQHQIETVSVSHLMLATVYDHDWFFAANDVLALKALLDHADRRRESTGSSLQGNVTFTSAMRHLPTGFAAMIYIDPRPFVQKLMPLISMTGQSLPMSQLERLREVQSVSSTVAFDHGQLRETDFVAMPRVGAETKLRRTLLGAAGANTVFYSLSRIHWSDQILSATATGLPAVVGQFSAALKDRGVSPDDLRRAFGEELEVMSDWAPDAHWPTFLINLPVNDPARAKKIVGALTSVEIADVPWKREDRGGATFYSTQPFGVFVTFQPAIAVSDKSVLAGSDLGAVEGALGKIAKPANELEKSAIFHQAVVEVPPADSAFIYVDTRLLFERADAAMRPLLLMGATFYPILSKHVDVTKFPPPDAIAKHLSPIVMSQRYERDGYVTESVGPVTLRQATLGLAGAIGGLLIYLREGSDLLQNILASPTPAGASPRAASSHSPAVTLLRSSGQSPTRNPF